MNCPECKGRGYVKLFRHGRMQCLECGGSGIASCCDAAGSRAAPTLAELAAVYRQRGSADSYVDPACPPRACDKCGALYRGPAVYCSLKCAMEDA